MADSQPTSFVAHLTTAAGKVDVTVGLNNIELSTWGLYEAVPWMKLSGFITDGSTTQNKTTSGESIIINWSAVQFVTYDNPWAAITEEQAIQFNDDGTPS